MRRTANPIYVESLIRADVEELWARTQEPAAHQRWDVRFTTITYLDRTDGEPQRFVYGTRVAPGLSIDGRGETLGERHRADGTAYSGLRFRCDHPLALIKEGAGYWRYVPTEDGVRFLTRYDYRPRWGSIGRLIDRRLFRPVFGWATAWSFDRLRLWIERGVEPEKSRNRALAHLAAVVALAAVRLHHGTTTAAMPAFTIRALTDDRLAVIQPFTPVTLGLAIAALAAVAVLRRAELPSGRHPLRIPPSTIDEEVPR